MQSADLGVYGPVKMAAQLKLTLKWSFNLEMFKVIQTPKNNAFEISCSLFFKHFHLTHLIKSKNITLSSALADFSA